MAVHGRWAEGVQRPGDLETTTNEDKQQTILEPTPFPWGPPKHCFFSLHSRPMIAVSQINPALSPFTACCSRVFVYMSVLKVTLVYQSIGVSQVTSWVKRDMERSEGYVVDEYLVGKQSVCADSTISVTNVLSHQNILMPCAITLSHIKQ